MTYKTRKRIWPPALMSLAVLGVLAMVVAFSAVQPQSAQAHPCDSSTMTAEEFAACDRDHRVDGLDPNDPNHEHVQAPPNQAPVLTGTPLSDVSLRVRQSQGPIDVSGVFEDPDEDDTLTYSASSDNESVANASIAGSQMTIVAGDIRGTARITVTASDGNGGEVSTSFTVTVAEAYDLTPETYLVEDLGEYFAIFDLAVAGSADDVTVTIIAGPALVDTDDDGVPDSPDGRITITDSDGLIGAGFVDEEETDLEGSLTVKATDAGSRAFRIEGECLAPGGMAEITVFDKDLNLVSKSYILCEEPPEPPPPPDRHDVSDLFTIASYDDWMYHDATDGYIVTDAAGNAHQVNMMTRVTGWLTRDEPVIHSQYTLGVSNVENLDNLANGAPRRAAETGTRQARNAAVEEGQRTVEVLVGAPHVQLTVTSMESGPAYIRFLDSNMNPFGTDVDEEPMWRGADVVGLDSQGRLDLNMEVELTEAMALAYDQYEIVTPGIVPGQRPANSYLMGNDGAYNQGTFRFFNPCPAVDHHFYVEVYEKDGKYLQTTEKVVCINPPGIVPSELSVTTFSDRPGEARLEWVEAIGATAHHVIVLDMTNPMRPIAVAGSYSRVVAPNTAANITGLSEGVPYRFAVAAERRDASGSVTYSMPSFIDQIMDWE